MFIAEYGMIHVEFWNPDENEMYLLTRCHQIVEDGLVILVSHNTLNWLKQLPTYSDKHCSGWNATDCFAALLYQLKPMKFEPILFWVDVSYECYLYNTVHCCFYFFLKWTYVCWCFYSQNKRQLSTSFVFELQTQIKILGLIFQTKNKPTFTMGGPGSYRPYWFF